MAIVAGDWSTASIERAVQFVSGAFDAVIDAAKARNLKVFATIGFAGWSVFNSTEHADDAWNLVAYLSSPESNATWAKRVGVIPIHQGADQDPFFKTDQFKGWFEELNSPDYIPTIMPTYLEQWGYFTSTVLKDTAQEALLGQKTAQELGDEWAAFLTDEYGKWKAKQ